MRVAGTRRASCARSLRRARRAQSSFGRLAPLSRQLSRGDVTRPAPLAEGIRPIPVGSAHNRSPARARIVREVPSWKQR